MAQNVDNLLITSGHPAAKTHENNSFRVPSPSTLVLPTKIPLPNQYTRTILPLERQGEESRG